MTILGFYISNKIVYPIIAIVIAWISILLDKIFIGRLIKANKNKSKHTQRSQNTVLLLIRDIIKYIIVIITIISILDIYGVNTSAIITSIGAISIVAGLAFQDVLKDILVGISIIMESQFAVGEIVEINGFKGEVIYLGLKTTKIKALTGEVRIISNRSISEITNYSFGKCLATIDISVSYEDDINKVEKVLNEVAESLTNSIPEISSKVTVDGINELSDSCVIFRLSTYVRNRDIPVVKRKFNRELKMALDKNKIKIPYPQIEVHNE